MLKPILCLELELTSLVLEINRMAVKGKVGVYRSRDGAGEDVGNPTPHDTGEKGC